jgi:hypothetical protein
MMHEGSTIQNLWEIKELCMISRDQFDEDIMTPEGSSIKNRREFKVLHTPCHKQSYF